MTTPPKRIMIIGPTASGKTDLAHLLAQELEGEIISVDSRQCYKRIDIGTAKPSPERLNEVPYHNISILDLDESDTAVNFLTRAETWKGEIEKRGRRVIYAGGSTLHLQGLIQPFDDVPAADPETIAELEQVAEKSGLNKLYERLKEVDPEYASAMDGKNRQRIIRALDVWIQTGRPFSSFHESAEPRPPGDLAIFGLQWPRPLLYQRINDRADRMIDSGLIGETQQILEDGYSPGLQSLQTVGYRDVIQYLDGRISKLKMVEDIKTQTRRYAKRQMTWFRRWPFVNWLEAADKEPGQLASEILDEL